MKILNLSDNIAALRRGKKLTQEQLADFIGVTKASVSKWETGNSMPDVVLLPQLAAFFGVTVDELIGYNPQLSKEQRMRFYQEFADGFATRPFEEVMEETREYVRRYYSCYPFLTQICGLWLNHALLFPDREKRQEIMDSVSRLCDHIKENARDPELCREVTVLQAVANLQLGRVREVVEELEETSKPYRFQGSVILTEAYRILGDTEKAVSYLQACMHDNILSLIANAEAYLSLRADDPAVCEETVRRIQQVSEVYGMNRLHPNSMAVFEYRVMLFYLQQGEKKKALEQGEKVVDCMEKLMSEEEIRLHGDAYFDRIEGWFEGFANGPNPPRNRQFVLEDVWRSFDTPAFALLEGDPEFERLRNRLKKIR